MPLHAEARVGWDEMPARSHKQLGFSSQPTLLADDMVQVVPRGNF
jgi:hypothetical protein